MISTASNCSFSIADLNELLFIILTQTPCHLPYLNIDYNFSYSHNFFDHSINQLSGNFNFDWSILLNSSNEYSSNQYKSH